MCRNKTQVPFNFVFVLLYYVFCSIVEKQKRGTAILCLSSEVLRKPCVQI